MAIFSSLANALLSFAFAEGLAIWFWTLTARGTTVSATKQIASLPPSSCQGHKPPFVVVAEADVMTCLEVSPTS